MKFQPNKSRTPEEKRLAWKAHTITGDITEVPGIGDSIAEVLAAVGITNTFQLLGDMLKHLPGPLDGEAAVQTFGDKLYDRLKGFNVSENWVHTIIMALLDKVENGIQIKEIEQRPESRINDEQWGRTRKMLSPSHKKYVLGGVMHKDFHYISEATEQKFSDHKQNPVKNSWQLLGIFLEHYDPSDIDGSLERFDTALKGYGNMSHKAIAAQAVEILCTGCLIVKRK